MALRLALVVLLVAGVWAMEQEHSANQLAEGDESEGRSCHGPCGVIEASGSSAHPTTGIKGTVEYQPLLDLLGTGLNSVGYALTTLPLLALNIAGIVLLGIIVHHLVGGGDTGPGYDYYSYSTYQPPPPSGGYSGSSGGHGHVDGSSYGRSLATPLFSMDTLNGLVRRVLEAVDKYEVDDA